MQNNENTFIVDDDLFNWYDFDLTTLQSGLNQTIFDPRPCRDVSSPLFLKNQMEPIQSTRTV